MLPNIMQDWILPVLNPGESRVLMYILRHTVGFADPTGKFGRKERDAISVKQFVGGITTGPAAGPRYLFDMGCGLQTSESVNNALKGLVEKGLVDIRYVCPKSLGREGHGRCDWEQHAGDPPPAVGKNTKSPACPRCGRTCTRSFALAEITPSDVIRFLNGNDPQKRQFTWDSDVQMPRFTSGDAPPPPTEEELRAQAIKLREQLWHAKLVDSLVARTEGYSPSQRKISLASRMKNFYEPVLELQAQYPDVPALVRYALVETAKNGVLDNPPSKTNKWYRYAIKVCKSKYPHWTQQGPPPGSELAERKRNSLPERIKEANALLSRASEYHDKDKHDEARALLSDLLAQVDQLAEAVGGDKELCEAALREAFKRGSSDFLSFKSGPGVGLDLYPEWTWPEGVGGA